MRLRRFSWNCSPAAWMFINCHALLFGIKMAKPSLSKYQDITFKTEATAQYREIR